MLRIVGGNTAQDGEWPWMVLLKINSGGSTFLCGGTIIDATHVLTAAHCTEYLFTYLFIYLFISLFTLFSFFFFFIGLIFDAFY